MGSAKQVVAAVIHSTLWLAGAFVLRPCTAQVAPRTHVTAAFYVARIKPLLEQNCLGCHGVGARLSGLDLRTLASALKGGTRGPALVPGHALNSNMYRLAAGLHPPQMPPTGKLPATSIALLRHWIDGGAPWPNSTPVNVRKQVWWSFRPPGMPAVPPIKSAWINNSIDAFVLQKLRSNGMHPNPPASRQALIRRAWEDLIGLPPTPEQVEAFVRDKRPDAWKRVVDGLLASPRYGERWGRHWLDLVRYADSGGFEGDRDRLLAWRYRDYVIDSFNADKPYNRFLTEQLAGDELDPKSPECIVATGYLACGPEDIVEHNARTRSNELDDLVATTGTSFMGLTVGCARCHDHKYDPIKQTDYYRLSAIFAPTVRKDTSIATPAEQSALDTKNAPIQAKLTPLRAQLKLILDSARPKLKKPMATDAEALAALALADKARAGALTKQIAGLQAQLAQPPMAMAVTDSGRTFGPCYLLVRGDAYQPGQEVQPGFVCSLPGGAATITGAEATAATTGRRLALARWITALQNPLTARVWVNRVWRQHFGRGIVNTPSNFGVSGELPTHPELLNWLALKFQQGGWQTKPLHRLILMSSTWQQSSAVNPAEMANDPQDRYYWRMPMRRLEAEAVRDTILAVTGSLNLKMYGPPVYPPIDPSLRADTFQGPNWHDGVDGPDTWRRSIYVKVKRSLLLPELEVFDCPEITYAVAERNVTITPTQALTLLNDPLIIKQAALFAQRLKREAGNSPAKQVDTAWRLAFARPPAQEELADCLNFLKTRTLQDLCKAIFNLNEFVYVP